MKRILKLYENHTYNFLAICIIQLSWNASCIMIHG